MGTQVLRPHDCLTQRIRLSPAVFHRRKTYGNGIPKVNRKPIIRSDRPEQIRRSPVQRKRSPEPLTKSKRSASADDLRNKNNDKLIHGKVTILRRGESLGSIAEAIAIEKKNVTEETAIYGTERLGPEPETVMTQVRVGLPDVYAGSAASMSPSPRALPLPSFFKRVGEESVEDSATKDLRRLLRLD